MVNNTPYEQLSKLQQYAVRLLVSDRDEANAANYAGLVMGCAAAGARATWNGRQVLLDLQDGGTVSFPLVLFSSADEAILQPGWDRW